MSVLAQARQRMREAVEAVGREFATVRTGKAVPALLDTVVVPAYGGRMPLNQVATVTAPEPSLLAVMPFDPSLTQAVEKAIASADLGLNPSNDGSLVRVPVPPLSEERRREFVRLLNKMAEDGRVSVRHARHAANDAVKTQSKDGEIGEDEAKRLLDEVQKLTREHGDKIGDLLERKTKEVMAI